jgi:hypothetical protein
MITTSTTTGYVDNTTTNPGWLTANPNWLTTPYTGGTTLISTGTTLNSNNMNKVQQTKVAVFKVTRNEENQVINTEFLKEMWVQTKAGVSVDFEVARDKDLIKYEAEDLVIKNITSLTF